MNAKTYLKQLKILDTNINQRIKEVNDLKLMATGTGSLGINPNKTQSSISNDKMSNTVVKYIDLEHKINQMIDHFIDQKDKIISEIQALSDDRYIQILYARYVEFKSFEQIAVDMCYEYKWLCKLHGYALKEFTDTVLHVAEDNTNKHEQTRTNTNKSVV